MEQHGRFWGHLFGGGRPFPFLFFQAQYEQVKLQINLNATCRFHKKIVNCSAKYILWNTRFNCDTSGDIEQSILNKLQMETAILNLKTMLMNIISAKSKRNQETSGPRLGQAQQAVGQVQMLDGSLFSCPAVVVTCSFSLPDQLLHF